MQERGPVLPTLSSVSGGLRPVPRSRLWLIAVVAAAVILVDQLTKSVAEHHLLAGQPRHVLATLSLDLTYNSGAAFSLGRGVTPVVETVVVVLVAGLLLFGRRAARGASVPVALGVGLLLGGAAGNLVDRVFRHNHGSVIDFVDILRVGHRDLWPVFNVADTAIVVGALTLVLAYSRKVPEAREGGRSSMADDVELTETVPAALEGQRVDRVVAMVTGRPRREVDDLVAAGRVRVAGRVTTNKSRKLHTGERLDVLVPPEVAGAADAPDPTVRVPVVWADEHVIVVDKPAGLVVHPGAGHSRGTMVQGLLAAYPDLAALASAPGGATRPGIVHRLDRGTSGLLVVARTAAARDDLVGQLADRTVERRYLALVHGTVEADEGLIDAPLGRADRDPTRIVVRRDGKEARARYRVLARYGQPGPASLLELRLETGRTHQIRVHVTAIGHPVVGDDRYGSRTAVAVAGAPSGRPWLHAAGLSFRHPVDGRTLSFSSPVPDDLASVLDGFSVLDGPGASG